MSTTDCQYDVVVVGAGAAGLLAAGHAAKRGCRTCLLEKNRQAGVKILMSGGTRCNITHATDQTGIAAAFSEFDRKQAGFLRSSLASLPPENVIELIESLGVRTKVEDTGKIFPVSNRAVDVRDALLRFARESGAELRYNFDATAIEKNGTCFVVQSPAESVTGRQLIVTTGGKSYPGCGTTGDGYGWARRLGHTIVNPVPALTPVTTDAEWVRDLKGITIPDAGVAIVETASDRSAGDYGAKQFLMNRRSSLLFTHFGFSGPAALDISRCITTAVHRKPMSLVCDFLPDQSFDEFLSFATGELRSARSRQVGKLVPQWAPRRLAESALVRANIEASDRSAELSKKQIRALCLSLKSCVVPISGTLGFRKAEVTSGGVHLKEVDSRTMQSKLVPDLYFAGEVLDIDGPIGGFNFQAAFSTGWLAGSSQRPPH